MTTNKTQPPGTYELVPLTQIKPTRFNPRTIDEKSEGFRKLLDSIKANGVMMPVHVRILPDGQGKLELLAGERRFRCAQAAGLKQIPAIHLGVLSDEEAFEVTFTENYAREDLTPLEEGKAVAMLLEKYGNDTKAAAGKLGRSVSWVAARAQIWTNLSKSWKEASLKNPRWTASHLAAIARLPQIIQDNYLETNRLGDGRLSDPPAYKEMTKQIDGDLHMLRQAKWNRAEAIRVEVAGKSVQVACDACTERSSVQPDLFDESWAGNTQQDRCLNAECWKAHQDVYLQQRFQDLSKQHKDLVLAYGDYAGREDVAAARKLGSRKSIVDYWSVKQTKKTDKNAVPALVVNGKRKGEKIWIKKPSASCQEPLRVAHAKPKTLKQRRDELQLDRQSHAAGSFANWIEQVSLVDLPADLDKSRFLMCVMATFGTGDIYGFDFKLNKFVDRWDVLSGLEGPVLEKAWTGILCKGWGMARNNLAYEIGEIMCSNIPIKHRWSSLERLAELLGYDLAFAMETASAALPEPTEWTNLKPDGTPKTKQKTSSKKAGSGKAKKKNDGACIQCGCTEQDCAECVEATGQACHWVAPGKCSRCFMEDGSPRNTPKTRKRKAS